MDRRDRVECEFSYMSLQAWFHIVFSQTSDQIESNFSALPVKKQHISLISQRNWWRLQTPAVAEDFVVRFAIRFFPKAPSELGFVFRFRCSGGCERPPARLGRGAVELGQLLGRSC